MDESPVIGAALEALKEGLDKTLESTARERLGDLAGKLSATWLLDSLGATVGKFGGEFAVSLLRQIVGIKDQLTRVEDRLGKVDKALNTIAEMQHIQLVEPLETALRDLEDLKQLGPPGPAEQAHFQSRVQSILDNLGKAHTISIRLAAAKAPASGTVSTAPRDEPLLRLPSVIDLLKGLVAAGYGPGWRVAAVYWQPVIPAVYRAIARLTDEMHAVPVRLAALDADMADAKRAADQAWDYSGVPGDQDGAAMKLFFYDQAMSRVKAAELARSALIARQGLVARQLNMLIGVLSFIDRSDTAQLD